MKSMLCISGVSIPFLVEVVMVGGFDVTMKLDSMHSSRIFERNTNSVYVVFRFLKENYRII